MRSFILAGIRLFAVASAAQAGSVLVGQASGNQGSAFSGNTTTKSTCNNSSFEIGFAEGYLSFEGGFQPQDYSMTGSS